MPRVVILCEYPSLNGGERSLLTMLDHARWGDKEIRFVAPAQGPLADAVRERGYRLTPITLHDEGGRRLPLPDCRQRLQQVLCDLQPALVHANSLSISRLLGPVAQSLSIPSLGHLRDIVRLSSTACKDLALNTRLLAVSEATRRWYVDLGIDADGIKVLYNGVDLLQFCPRPACGYLHRELGIPANTLLVGAVGQICLRKSWDALVAAAARIAAQRQDVHFLAVGQRYSQKHESIEYESQLRLAASRGALRGRFHWLGVRDDVARLMNELSLLLHPARQEPLGRVLLEAAASGLPCVATGVGGTMEIFPPGSQTAVIVPPDDPHALSNAALALLNSEDQRNRISGNARRRAEAMFNAGRAARQLFRHYASLLAE